MPLRITLELIPHGDENKKRVVGTLDITNTGTHPEHPKLADYHFRMTGSVHGGGIDIWHEGVVKNVDRARGYWAHVKDILNTVDCNAEPFESEEE